jgi:hypothetical protein
MSVDHKVDFRSEEALARFANDLRRRAYKKGKGRYVLDIIDLIERVLAEYFAPRGGLRIDVFDGDKFDEPACVTYRPQLCIFGEISGKKLRKESVLLISSWPMRLHICCFTITEHLLSPVIRHSAYNSLPRSSALSGKRIHSLNTLRCLMKPFGKPRMPLRSRWCATSKRIPQSSVW